MSSTATDKVDIWTDEELACWLAFDQLPPIGPGRLNVHMLFDRFGSMTAFWKATKREILDARCIYPEYIDELIAARAKTDPDKLLAAIDAADTEAIPIAHPNYPAALFQIKKAPTVLYVRGTLEPADLVRSIAVVGTRRPTSYGQRMAKKLGRGLAEIGATVVSGMAVGVDSLAHWGAIEGGGRTLAVAACGPDLCTPTSNKLLYRKLVDGGSGAIISEYFPGTPPARWTFPQRNRIISGLCEGVLIIEAGETSGALITANMAFDQGRQVFALPGRVDNPMADGTNKLIASCKAQLIFDENDLVTHLGTWQAKNRAKAGVAGEQEEVEKEKDTAELSENEKTVFGLIGKEPVHFDSLCDGSKIPVGLVSAALTMLELGRFVERLPGDHYARL